MLKHIRHAVGAHIGVIYLLVPERQVLKLTTVIGAPRRLALPWARLAMAEPAPVPAAVRSQRHVWLPDQQEFARRFPRAALAFPYSVAHYVGPLVADGVCWGALNLFWPGSRAEGLPAADRERIIETVDQMAEVLRDAAARGRPVRPRKEPLVIAPPPAPHAEPANSLVERFPYGFFALDVHGRMTFLTSRAVQLLGRDLAELLDSEPWDVLPWLNDPVYENAFVGSLIGRQPTSFSARRPDGAVLSFLLYPDATGISVRVRREIAPVSEQEPSEDIPLHGPARAGALFHLLHLASALTETTGVSEVTQSVVDQMRPVLGAEGLALVVADEGRVRVLAACGFPSGMLEHFNGLPMATPSAGTRTMETGIPAFHPTTTDLVRIYPQHQHYREMGAFAFLPLTVSGGAFGLLVLGYSKARNFSSDERAELTSLAGMIAQALDRARLYDANAHTARGLQEGLLPGHLPQGPGLEIVARHLPATHALEVGGDFYDVIRLVDGTAAAVIGDVQGHSVQAAALMGQIRTAVHIYAGLGVPPEEVLARTNTFLLEQNSDLFCSCLYAQIDVPGQRVRLASAGHPPAILRRSTDDAEVLDLPPGLLLGVEGGMRWQTVDVPLPPGAVLALYTDGLVERRGTDIGFSIDRLAQQLARADDQPLDLLADMMIKHAQETAVPENSDDIALLLLRCGTGAGSYDG
nr:SpoIIE family protein phosphatase [Streptomyces sp. SID4948]